MENNNKDKNLIDELESNPILDSLCNFIRNGQPAVKVLNLKRYYEILFAKEALDDLLRQNGEEIMSEIKFHPTFSSASLAVEVESFEVTDMVAFKLAMSRADNFEFYPLINGKVRLAFVFQRMMIAVE